MIKVQTNTDSTVGTLRIEEEACTSKSFKLKDIIPANIAIENITIHDSNIGKFYDNGFDSVFDLDDDKREVDFFNVQHSVLNRIKGNICVKTAFRCHKASFDCFGVNIRAHDDIGITMSKVSGACLSIDSGASVKCRDSIFSEVKFKYIYARGEDERRLPVSPLLSFVQCSFLDATSFEPYSMRGGKFQECNFEHIDATAKSFMDCTFNACIFHGNFMGGKGVFRNCRFEKCVFLENPKSAAFMDCEFIDTIR